MAKLTFGSNRAYPSIPSITDDASSHTAALKAMKEALEIHERRTKNYLDSFVRVSELVDLGLIELNGNTFNVIGEDISDHSHDDLYYTEAEVDALLGGLSSDHGDLDGLADNDHPQYALLVGDNEFVGTNDFDGDVGISGTLTIGTNSLIFDDTGIIVGADTVLRNTQGTNWTELRVLDGAAGSTSGMLLRDSGDSGGAWTAIIQVDARTMAFGVVGDSTTGTRSINVTSDGFARVSVQGDASNSSGEPGGAAVIVGQDGGAVYGIFGVTQTNDGSGLDGVAFTGSLANDVVIGNMYNSASGHFRLGTRGIARVTITGDGDTLFPYPVTFYSADTNPGAGFSRVSEHMLHLDGKEAIDGVDGFLRLNQNGDFTSGVYTPGVFRADGGILSDAASGGSVSNPGFSWNDDSDSGMYQESANVVAIGTAGARCTRFLQVNTGRTATMQHEDHQGTLRDSGFNDLQDFNVNASDTLEASHCGTAQLRTTSTARTLTLEASGSLDFPVGGITHIFNVSTSGNYTVTEGAGTLLYRVDAGSGRADTGGSATVGPGGMATIWRWSDTVYYIWGSEVS